MKQYIIYTVLNNLNGKVYHGKHVTIKPNDDYFGSGTGIKNAIAKYGKENFTKIVRFKCRCEDIMCEMEEYLSHVEDWPNNPNCYNQIYGGEGGWSDINRHPNIQQWRSEAGKKGGKIGGKKAGMISAKRQIEANVGWFDPLRALEIRQKSAATNRRNKTAAFDPEVRRRATSIARAKALLHPELNPTCKKIEYKGTIYYGWDRLRKATGVTKDLYNAHYLRGYDPESRIGKDGPIKGNTQLEPLARRV